MRQGSHRRLRSAAVGAMLLVAWLQAFPVFGRDIVLAVSSGPVSLPVYVAEAKGFFKAEGVDVTTRDCTSGRDCIAILADGRADIATAAELVVTLDSLTRADLAIIATLSSSHQIRVVARRGIRLAWPGDLPGKRLGTVTGTSAEYYLDTWLLFHGIDRSEVTVVSLPADQLAGALQRHEIDGVAIWEPLAAAAAEVLGAEAVLMPTPRVYTQHFTLVATRDRLVAQEADLVRVLRALARASRLIAQDAATARLILQTRLAISEAKASAYMQDHDYALNLDQSLVSTMESQARWALRSKGSAGTKPFNVLRAIDPQLLRTAAPGAVTLVR